MRRAPKTAKKRNRAPVVPLPPWVKSIPLGQHGSGKLQKRLWRLTSDYVRIRDFHAFNRSCIATNLPIRYWYEGQAGHYRAYSTCNGIFKFDPINIHLQTGKSNIWPSSFTWDTFRENLAKRYGPDIVKVIDETNRRTGLRITTLLLLEEMRKRIGQLKSLPEQPPYFKRVWERFSE